jgi:hypothetical protein
MTDVINVFFFIEILKKYELNAVLNVLLLLFGTLFPPGAYDSIRSSYNKSRDAERRANQSTTATPSTVSQSADTRRKTERLISAKKDGHEEDQREGEACIICLIGLNPLNSTRSEEEFRQSYKQM